MITATDESFHPAEPNDVWWTETSWFGFFVPERRLSGTVYAFFRPTLGVCSGTVYVWDDSAELPWEVLYGRALLHLPPPAGDLTDVELENGLRLRCASPLRRHSIQYEDGEALRLDLTFDAVTEPHGLGPGGSTGHFDQPGRVRGTATLHGEQISVDCISIRDRTWSPRSDLTGFAAGYSYAVTDGEGFHAVSVRGGADNDVVVAGFLWRDGTMRDLVSGSRTVEREDGRPVRVTIQATDDGGRTVEATGVCMNRLAFPAYPGNFTWMSLTRWTIGSREVWGEDQDIWAPDLWRTFRRRR